MDLQERLAAEHEGLEAAIARVCAARRPGPLLRDVGRPRLGAMVDQHLQTGGKRLRGLLPAALVRAGGGPMTAAWTLGACVELVHNGTLIHDDIQDGDALRRGQPTLWSVHGAAQAINAGSVLYAAPLAALASDETIAADARAPLAALLASALADTIAGQVADLDLHGHIELDRDTICAIAIAKTAPLFGAAIAGAGLLLDRPAYDDAAQAARALGLAFQVRDDLLDLVGTKGRGSAGADLREGKLTLPLRFALDRAERRDGEALLALLQDASAGEAVADDDVARWVRWAHDAGGVDEARALLAALADEASCAAERALPAPAAAVLQAFARRLGDLDG